MSSSVVCFLKKARTSSSFDFRNLDIMSGMEWKGFDIGGSTVVRNSAPG